jgi:hypothetical protein
MRDSTEPIPSRPSPRGARIRRMRRFRTCLLLFGLLSLGLVLSGCRDEEVAEVVPLALDEALIRKTIARLGNGYLVWERFRNNNWEIWIKKLNGGREKRFVPGERGHDHFCPKVSPDGRTLSYMSYPNGTTPYPGDAGKTGALWIMQVSNRKRKLIAEKARSYAEDRAVTWFDNKRLCYVDGEGFATEYNLDTGKTRRLVKEPHESFGYLVSPDMHHATSGVPEFAKYDAGQQFVRHQQRMMGCQPYFTQDSHWGFWMGGAGGPLNKMRLATREIGQVLVKDDPRLHGKRNYIYFPMVSPCQRLLAFAASPDKHDHFEADYDIYIAHVHPQNFEIVGHPVRYTKYQGCDRFPDVFRRELPLGTQYVEGGTEMEFNIPKEFAGNDWHWHITGKFEAEGRSVKRTFSKPGEYWVDAKRGDVRVRGYVNVREAAAPRVEGVRRDGKESIVVDFDEPVTADKAVVALADGTPLRDWKVVEEGYAIAVKLPAGTGDNAALSVEGFTDRAQKPNRMERTAITVPSTAWPASDEGMMFVWENTKGRTRLPNGNPCEVRPHGLAFCNEHGAMKLRGGWFDAPDAGELVSSSCMKSHEVTVEMIVTPQPLAQGKELHRIITLANSDDERNLTIGQRGSDLVLWLRTPQNGPAGNAEESHLATVDSNQPHHIVVAYKQDKLTVWVNGTKVHNRNRIRGDFSNWENMKLRFGASAEGKQPWRGLIDRVVIYDRCLSDTEIAQHSNSSIVAESKRNPPQAWKVVAKLVETSPVPKLQEFQPYKEALLRHCYEILEVKEGEPLPDKRVAVSHWAWLDAQPLPGQKLKLGDVVEMTLHREEAHEELKALFVKDELIEGLTAERFLDASDWDMDLLRR